LLLHELALDDEPTGAVYGTCRAHFCKEELDDMFWLSVHALADL